jgi:hypothetical protein
MKETGILFNAAMVRAILDERKTMTRRVVKDIPRGFEFDGKYGHIKSPHPKANRFGAFIRRNNEFGGECDILPCPYGQPGDRLWVKEKWNACPVTETDEGFEAGYPYKPIPKTKPANACLSYATEGDDDGPWRPSIHMPRWASRITLEITGVRVEWLNDISEEDAIAEGIEKSGPCIEPERFKHYTSGQYTPLPRHSFESLWKSINGPDSWAANPWVWVIEFKKVSE